jgi:ribosomal protein S14
MSFPEHIRKISNAGYKARKYTQLKTKCERCGSQRYLVRHHPDYSKPLYVMTLCRSCHIQIHLQYKPYVGSLGASLCPKCRNRDVFTIENSMACCGTCKSVFSTNEIIIIKPKVACVNGKEKA